MIKVVSPSWRGQLRISSPMIKAEREFFACAFGTLTSRPPVVTRSMVARESVRAGPTNRQESAKIPRRIKMMRLKFGEWNRTIMKFGLSLECATPKIFFGSFPNRLQLTRFCPNELRKQRRGVAASRSCDEGDFSLLDATYLVIEITVNRKPSETTNCRSRNNFGRCFSSCYWRHRGQP